MTVQQFIEDLAKQQITLWKEGDSLRYRAPRGAISGELLARIKERKEELLAVLGEEAAGGAAPGMIQPDGENLYQPFPLPDVQQAYWIGRSGSYELGNIGCHIYFELENTNLDVDRLNAAWQRVVDRHPMLRAVILPDGRQQILPEVPEYVFKRYDLREKNPSEVLEKLESIRSVMSHQVMKPEEWPSFDIRVSLYDDRVRLHVSLDYLFADASSHLLLFNEWHTFYENPDISLPPLEFSFRDYVLEQLKRKNSAQHRRAEKYWLDRIDTFPPAPPLPLLKDAAEITKPRFVRRVFQLDAERWSSIKKRAAAAKLTSSGVLQAAFAQVLGAWSNASRFTLNLTLFNRENIHPQAAKLIGEFTSLILLEVDYSQEESFIQRARRLQKQLLDDLDHRSVSAVQVLRELARRRGSSENAAMPIVFTSTLGYGAEGPDDLEVFKLGELVYSITQTPQVWLDHQVMEFEGGLLYNWDAVDELFPPGLVDDMFQAYTGFLHRLADSEAVWQETRPDFMPEAQRQKRIEVNETGGPLSSETLYTLFAAQAERHPEQMAVTFSGGTLTYGELARRSAQVASLLNAADTRQGELVAVVMEKGWEQVAAVLGILQAGKAYLPVDPTLPEDRLKFLLEDGEVKQVLTQSRFKHLAWPRELTVILLDALDYNREYPLAAPVQSSPEDLAYVIYTSGSTGRPKGVMINHRGAVNTLLDINQRFAVGPSDRVLAISSLSFDLSVYDLFGILAAGGTVVLPDPDRRTDPQHWAELVEQEQVTLWNTVPTLMQMYVEYLEERSLTPGDSLRLVLMSGDWIPVDLPGRIRSRFQDIRLISLGGATEASIWSILHPIGEIQPHWKSIPYGRPMVNQRFYVLNQGLEDCPYWVPGQLYIGGEGLALGYWKDPEKTAARFMIHPRTGERLYNTGDRGRFRPEGLIEFLGREDFQVKIRGYRIELGEIEAVLKQHRDVTDAVVNVDAGPKGERRLVAYIIGDPENPPVFKELEEFLEKKLPGYMVPKEYLLLEALPLNVNGKVDRKALPKSDRREEELQAGYVAPRTPLEKRLAALWAEVLERDQVGLYDDFFAIGGDSLIATRLVLKIRESLKVDLSLPKLFDAPTVAQLAERIKTSEEIPSEIEMELLSSVDLIHEAVLEPEITAKGLPPVAEGPPSKVLLTGATGFLGAFLLHELLQATDARIYCLLRAANNQEGQTRLQKNLERYSLWDPSLAERIIPVVGDLTEPLLGLSLRDYQYLAENVDVIYHNGALVHFLYSYSIVKPANVTGTRQILRLACQSRIKPVHYVSTISVFSDHGFSGTRVIQEDNRIDDSGVLDTGYAQSKWVAEKLVWTAGERGLPVTVYRPGLVMGDSRKGIGDVDDFIFRVFKGSLQVGCVPEVDVELDALPVDCVSKAIVALSRQEDSRGRVFHLLHPRPVHLKELVHWIRSKGHDMEDVPWNTWRSRLVENARDNALYPLLPMFPEGLEEEEGKLVFSLENTVQKLEGLALDIPSIDNALLNTYYTYLTRVGFIPAGEGQ